MQPDLTLLGIIFGVNIGFSTVDSLVGDLLSSLRDSTSRSLDKYRDAKWMRSIAPTDTAKDEAKRNLLTRVVRKALEFADTNRDLFKKNVFAWKIAMAVAAAVAFVFMAIPYAPWWSAFLILPVPLCFLSCLAELGFFWRKLKAKCNEVESMCGNLKEEDASTGKEPDNAGVEARLAAIEALLRK